MVIVSIGMSTIPIVKAPPPIVVEYDGYVIGYVDLVPHGPVEGATVILKINGFPAAATSTNEDGYFSLLYFRPWNPSLYVTHPWYYPSEIGVYETGGTYTIGILSIFS